MTGATHIEAKKRLCRSEHTFPLVLGAMLSAGILLTAMLSAQTRSAAADPVVQQQATSHAGMATGGVHQAEFDKASSDYDGWLRQNRPGDVCMSGRRLAPASIARASIRFR
jgi:hypothetical protein